MEHHSGFVADVSLEFKKKKKKYSKSIKRGDQQETFGIYKVIIKQKLVAPYVLLLSISVRF